MPIIYDKTTPISPTQFCMARGALRLSIREVASMLGVNKMAISKHETVGEGLGYSKLQAFEAHCRDRGIFLGPKDTVSVGSDAFGNERFMVIALHQILKENGIFPTSTDLIEAYDRAEKENS